MHYKVFFSSLFFSYKSTHCIKTLSIALYLLHYKVFGQLNSLPYLLTLVLPNPDIPCLWNCLIVLGFNIMPTLMGLFMLSYREREKRDKRDRGDKRWGQGRKRNRNESEETEEIKKKHFPSTLTCYKDIKPCPTVSQYQLDAMVKKNIQPLQTL